MKTAIKIGLVLILSLFGVLAQSYFPYLNQWIFIYLVVFVVAWFGDQLLGTIATIFGLCLGGFVLIPNNEFSFHHFVEILFLIGLGLWLSFLMDRYKRSLLKISANEELNKTRGFLDTLLENIPMMVFVKDATELRFVKFNQAGLDLLGFDRNDLIGKNDYDMFPADQAEHFTQKDREVLLQKGELDIPYEVINTKFRGRRILHTRKIPVHDEFGKPLYLLGVSEDITDRVAAEEERIRNLAEVAMKTERTKLQERENFVANAISTLSTTLDYHEALRRLSSVFIPVMGDWATLIVKNDDGQIVRVASTHFNVKLHPCLEEFTRDYPITERDFEIIKALEKGESSILKDVDLDYLISRVPDPKKLELYKILGAKSSMVVPIKFRDKVLAALSIARGNTRDSFDEYDLMLAEDIGRRAGAVLENTLLFKSSQVAVKARDEFLSIASHELKTPITALKMQLQMLLRQGSVDDIQKPITNAVKQIDRLTVLVDDLLNVSKIESGKMSYSFTLTSIGELVKNSVDNFKNQFAVSGVELNFNLESDGEVLGDRFRLEQVLVNLLSNALKYGEGKPVNVSVRSSLDQVEFSVKDHGKGIPQEVHDKIFNKFDRGRQDLNISGLGLGLFISKEIVLAHRGKISIASGLGQGSEFKVLLPRIS